MKMTRGVIKMTRGVMKMTRGVIKMTWGVIKLTRGVKKLTRGVIKLTRGVIKVTRGVIKMTRVRESNPFFMLVAEIAEIKGDKTVIPPLSNFLAKFSTARVKTPIVVRPSTYALPVNSDPGLHLGTLFYYGSGRV